MFYKIEALQNVLAVIFLHKTLQSNLILCQIDPKLLNAPAPNQPSITVDQTEHQPVDTTHTFIFNRK